MWKHNPAFIRQTLDSDLKRYFGKSLVKVENSGVTNKTLSILANLFDANNPFKPEQLYCHRKENLLMNNVQLC